MMPKGPPRRLHELVERDDLLDRVGLHALLSVAEGGVRDPDLLRHAHGYAAVVERDLRHVLIGEQVVVEVRPFDVLQGVFVILLLQQIGLVG